MGLYFDLAGGLVGGIESGESPGTRPLRPTSEARKDCSSSTARFSCSLFRQIIFFADLSFFFLLQTVPWEGRNFGSRDPPQPAAGPSSSRPGSRGQAKKRASCCDWSVSSPTLPHCRKIETNQVLVSRSLRFEDTLLAPLESGSGLFEASDQVRFVTTTRWDADTTAPSCPWHDAGPMRSRTPTMKDSPTPFVAQRASTTGRVFRPSSAPVCVDFRSAGLGPIPSLQTLSQIA